MNLLLVALSIVLGSIAAAYLVNQLPNNLLFHMIKLIKQQIIKADKFIDKFIAKLFEPIGISTSTSSRILGRLIMVLRNSLVSSKNITSLDFHRITRFFRNHIDEELQAMLIDKKTEWKNSEMTEFQISVSEWIYLMESYWGHFMRWFKGILAGQTNRFR
jgi:hypothetical protein